jgi:hypothetical protein
VCLGELGGKGSYPSDETLASYMIYEDLYQPQCQFLIELKVNKQHSLKNIETQQANNAFSQ